ncbi:unnamed protein product [Mytilus edulis]|uniref:Chromo domain-containing protein n=1 Tax=Mytilus edulis TaxID=6550 RepID=A0A8S3SEL7_MYTED|nr:unnamed protein product [Mytilus edulis]
MLFCKKVKKGQSPKLKVRWTGPFTITNLGPQDCNTFKLRRDSDNKISKKLVNTSRLKVFNSKTDPPDYLLDDTDDPFEEDEDDEELQITPDDVEKIISSAWVNKKLCYKIKIKNMSKTEWVHQDKIPENMRREFHENRTHTGKKRKRPLLENKHQFFVPSNEQQNVTAIDQNNDVNYKQRPKINWDKFPVQTIKLENNRFFVKTILRNNRISHYQPLNRVNGEDQHAFTYLLAYFYGDQFYNIMLTLTGNSQTKDMGPVCFVTGSHITHFKIENNVPKCFIHYEQRHVYDPEWVPFETCPPGLLKNFQDKYEDEWMRSVAGWLPQRLQEELTWNSTANLSGGPGNNLALDLVNEFQNNEFKSNLRNAYGQYSDRQVQRCSRLVGSLGKGIENIFETKIMHQYRRKAKSSRHSHKDSVQKFVKIYLPENLFDRNVRRHHPGFSGFNNAVVVSKPEKLSCRLKKYSKVLEDEAYILED